MQINEFIPFNYGNVKKTLKLIKYLYYKESYSFSNTTLQLSIPDIVASQIFQMKNGPNNIANQM